MTTQPNATRTLYGGSTRSRDRRAWRRIERRRERARARRELRAARADGGF
jgi:hypothetical protein